MERKFGTLSIMKVYTRLQEMNISGKTIESYENDSCNVFTIKFTDGTFCELEAEGSFNGLSRIESSFFNTQEEIEKHRGFKYPYENEG